MVFNLTTGKSHKKPAAILPLTGIRGLAALAVVFYHLPSMGLNGPALYGNLAPLVDQGWLGVDLFFILSGLVLSLVHQQDFAQKITWPEVKRFWQLRFARVYPLHLFLLLIYGAIIGLQTLLIKPIGAPELTTREFMGALFLLQIWMPIHSWFNAPSWSISAEAVAYLTFPVWAFLTSRIRLWAGNALALATLVLAFAKWPWGHWLFFWQVSPGTPVHSVDAVFRILTEFAMGCLLFNLCKPAMAHAEKTHPEKRGLMTDVIGLALLGLLPLAFAVGLSHTAAVVWFLALLACLLLPGPRLNQLLGNARMVYLGEISYAIYLCHMLVMVIMAPIFRRLPAESWVQWAAALPYLAVVIWLGHMLYQNVETPARLWFRQKFTEKSLSPKSVMAETDTSLIHVV